YDFVKVYSLLQNKPYHAIADEARKLKFPFAGHVPYSVGLLEAADAGQLSSEHLMGVAVSSSAKELEIEKQFDGAVPGGLAKVAQVSKALVGEASGSFDKAKYDELVKALAKKRFWQCPTLVVLKSIAYLDDAKKDDPRLKYMSPYVTASWDPEKDFRF